MLRLRVYVPEEPFVHGNLVRGGRLKSFPGLGHESVTAEYRQPCVMFTGHLSLRCRDAVHFVELWANNANNVGGLLPSHNFRFSKYFFFSISSVHRA